MPRSVFTAIKPLSQGGICTNIVQRHLFKRIGGILYLLVVNITCSFSLTLMLHV